MIEILKNVYFISFIGSIIISTIIFLYNIRKNKNLKENICFIIAAIIQSLLPIINTIITILSIIYILFILFSIVFLYLNGEKFSIKIE